MNHTYEELRTEIVDHYDVIVVGGGPAGIGAAVAAARNGCDTLLIERYGFLGGMWTAGLINPFFDHEHKGGIVKEIVDTLKDKDAWGGFRGICFNFEVMKNELDIIINEAGVTPLYHTFAVKTIMNDNAVKGVITESKSGRKAFTANIVIDCTGDGDIAYHAGAEYKKGRPKDGKMQPMTLMFVLGNINYDQTSGTQLYKLMKEATERYNTNYEIKFMRPYIIQLPNTNHAVVQLTHIRNFDGTKAEELTKAEIEGRKQVNNTVSFFKKYISNFKDIELVYTAPQIGIRETRRILGEYMLTKEDLLNGRKFKDGITTVHFNIDIHKPDDLGQENIKVKPYQIPFRCLIPKKLRRLLVAGRCISGTYEAHASYRVTGDCLAMGQAAGTAAAIASHEQTQLRKLTSIELLSSLRNQNVKI